MHEPFRLVEAAAANTGLKRDKSRGFFELAEFKKLSRPSVLFAFGQNSAWISISSSHSQTTGVEMNHRRNSSASSTAASSHSFHNNDSSISSASPLNSPLVSPLNSPFESPGGSPREQLHNSFANNLSLQPPSPQSSKSSSSNTFVHKLYK